MYQRWAHYRAYCKSLLLSLGDIRVVTQRLFDSGTDDRQGETALRMAPLLKTEVGSSLVTMLRSRIQTHHTLNDAGVFTAKTEKLGKT
jgi:hypothetical protein